MAYEGDVWYDEGPAYEVDAGLGERAYYEGSANGNVIKLTQSDLDEYGKVDPYTPTPAGAEKDPWWTRLVSYGVTKAIDNTLPGQSTGMRGNTSPGTFAGQNGRTYSQVGGINASPIGVAITRATGMSPIMLGALALGVYLLLKK